MKWIYQHPRLYSLLDSVVSLSLADRVRRKVLEKRIVGSLLEIGVGTGKCLNYIGAEFVVGLDRSEAMLDFLKKRSTTRLVLGDAHILPFKGKSFDVALFCYCLAGLRQPLEAVRQALRASKEVIVIDYNRPKGMPVRLWRWIVCGIGSIIFGSRDVDFVALAKLGKASVQDFYLGLYRVVVLNGAPDAGN